jgi:hypothetical protein
VSEPELSSCEGVRSERFAFAALRTSTNLRVKFLVVISISGR